MSSEITASGTPGGPASAAGTGGTGRDIAIIGMAARLPEADDVRQFLRNLREGRDSVRELTADRIGRTSLPADEQYQLCGFLDDIDSFDHAFFGISKGEAQNMAPEHRLLLQTAYQAVENAGYAPASLDGVRGSVYVADTKIEYDRLARDPEATMVMGTHVSAMAGRLSRFFGLRGTSAMVDSACSSGLLAVHQAAHDLILGESELAMACGVSLNVLADHRTGALDIGIRSADGKARAFSADASGTGSGEAVAAVLLKPLHAALRDGDTVHAVIKGTAANSGASRSSTLTAPDSAAQAEVIELAWRKAGIDPTTVSYVEAHGTGTRLGDPIEIEGLDLAFGRVTERKNFVAVSTVKSNIGHTWSVSGLVGLIKAVLALRTRQLFPSLHAAELNPLIDFANSAVSVTRELTPWEPAAGLRRAGVSAFGVMGTNVHAVLEEAPPAAAGRARNPAARYFVPLSAKSPTALRANADALRHWIEDRSDLDPADVAHTLTAGRDHHPHRLALTASTLTELTEALAAAAERAASAEPAGPVTTALLVSGVSQAAPGLVVELRAAHPHFDERYRQAMDAGSACGVRDEQFAFQFAFLSLLGHIGLGFEHVVAQNAGKHAWDAANGRVDLAEALRRAASEDQTVPADLDQRVDRLLGKLTGTQHVLFIEAGPLSTISRALTERAGDGYDVLAVDESGLAGFLGALYTAGVRCRWDACAGPGRRVELPSYRFDRIRCWLPDDKIRTRVTETASGAAQADGTTPLEAVTAVWRDVLGLESLKPDASFFDLGGDSISAMQVMGRLSGLFGVELDEYAIFDHENPQQLADYVRAALPASGAAQADGTTPLEAVTAVWRDVLGLESLKPDASFFDLGGDSISAMQVMGRLSGLFGVELDEYAIFDHENPQQLADYVQKAVPAATVAPAGETAPSTEPYPASPAQLNIWLASQFEGGSAAFNLTRSFRLDGHVDTDALRRALDALAQRHDALRTTFAFTDGGLTQATTAAEGFIAPLVLERFGGPRPDDARIAEAVRPFASTPFDLATGPLVRAQLATFGGDEHVLTLSTHHIVADGWSLELLVRDLSAFYAAFANGAPLDLPPVEADYRHHHIQEKQRADERRATASAYWREQYADVPAAIDLPVRSGVGGEAFSGAYRDYALPARLWERLKQFARAEGGTVFTSVVSAFAALLARYTDEGDLVLGTSLSGRGRQSTEQLVGMLVRTLPLRLQVDDEAGFRDMVAQTRARFTEGARHGDHPYEELVQDLQRRGLTHASHLFDVLIEFEQFAGDGEQALHAMASDRLRVTPLDVTLRTSVFPLNIMLAEQAGTLEAAIRFDTRLFDTRTVDQLWDSFTGLLTAVLERPDAPLRRLPLLTREEEQRVRTIGAHTFDFDASLKIHAAVERFARTHPDRVCLVAGSEQRTYAELNARANRLARYFRDELHVRTEEVVALVMDRSLLTVESILALWKCGAAYMPVDPGYPPSYVTSMLESSQVRVVALDPNRISAELRGHIGDGRTVVELTGTTGAGLDSDDPGITTDDSAMSYVIYTSGSTGVPKGVMVEHLGMLNHLHSKIDDLALNEHSVVAQNASNSFDISVWQMFAALHVGGKTVIYDAALQLDPVRFGERVDADGITVLEVVPSYLDTMLDTWARAGRHFDLSALTHLMVTGEAVLPRSVNRWLTHYPHVPVVNAYGPTEASDDVTHHVMAEPVTTDTVPLGKPVHNTLIYVLDEHLRVCPQGMKGEIYVSGIGVSRGYLNAPEQTARVFLRDPFQPERRMYRTGDAGRWTAAGTLEYLGRTDSQVKVRGFRIDLGEIERRVDACPGVKAAAVVVRAGAKDRLCAYVVLEPGTTVAECRTRLHRELPHHMVPGDFVEIDGMPLTSNGKVDRKSLARRELPSGHTSGAVAPRTEAERVLADIWREVLDTEEVGVTEPFFEIGGNSLRAIQVLSRIRSRLGVALDLEVLFAQPTIAALAAALQHAEGDDEAIVSLGGPGSYPVAHTQTLLLRAEETYSRPDAFHRNDLYRLTGDVDPAALERGFARLVERHEALRTTFARRDGRWTQIVHEPGALPLPFALHDLTGRPAAEARRFAEDRIRVAFSVADEPLIRADLLRTDENWLLVTSMHQLVSDGRTVDVLTEDWLTLYDALVDDRDTQLEPLPVQYKDTAQWRNARMTGEREEEHRRFWTAELAGAGSVLDLTTDRPRPARTSFPGGRVRRTVPQLASRLADLASAHAVTEFVVAKTAVSLLLAAETGRTDITVGTYTRGRNRLEFENQIGFYINTVPLRTRLEPDDTAGSVLRTAQRDVLRAFQHEEYPYEWTMRDLGWERGPDRSPVFDVMVAMDLAEAAEASGPGRHRLEFERLELPRRAKEADLQFVFDRTADGGMEIAVTYDSELFDAARVEHLAERLEQVVEALAADRPLVDILTRTPASAE
ncbi:amino acid adenylation domain-containing protein [Streptomyces glaucus]|uniref:Non-ribosomal peptide synthetase n=1 Tax=Streptomyces glaucus TaxID=284029 RepID=A0ABN3J9X9_9ACTN